MRIFSYCFHFYIIIIVQNLSICNTGGQNDMKLEELINQYYNTLKPNPDKPEKLFLFSTPCVILKKKGVFICYSLINTLIKFMASLPVMTA